MVWCSGSQVLHFVVPDESSFRPRLKLSGEAVQKTSQLFEAKPGQISMGPQDVDVAVIFLFVEGGKDDWMIG